MSYEKPVTEATNQLTHKEIMVILGGLMMGMFLAALDQTIVSTALKSIVEEFDGLNHYTWVVTAYLLTSTASTPLYGKISDIYGRRVVFQFAIVVFLIGSFLAGASQNSDGLLVNLNGINPVVRKDFRHLWATRCLSIRNCCFLDWLLSCRGFTKHGAVDCYPRIAGSWCRWINGAYLCDHRRHRLSP